MERWQERPQAGGPLARTGMEKRPRIQEETQRLSHQVYLVVMLGPGGDRAADIGGLCPSPAHGGSQAVGTASLEPECRGRLLRT